MQCHPLVCLLRFLMNSRWTKETAISRRLAYRTNDRSYNLTDSSLVAVDYQESLLAFFAKLLIRHVHGHTAYYVITCNCTCAFLWLLQMCIVYTATSSSTVVQDLHTALGWIACTDVRRGFCTRVLHSLCSKAFIHIHKYTSVVNIPNAAILPLWLGRCLITQSLPTGHPFPSSKWSSFTTVVESSLGQSPLHSQ